MLQHSLGLLCCDKKVCASRNSCGNDKGKHAMNPFRLLFSTSNGKSLPEKEPFQANCIALHASLLESIRLRCSFSILPFQNTSNVAGVKKKAPIITLHYATRSRAVLSICHLASIASNNCAAVSFSDASISEGEGWRT